MCSGCRGDQTDFFERRLMFLKSVKARGFKSFARSAEFGFESGITVVVGPNGSGKSNIADAVMWAMGEQSPSAVRGASMQDVIFSGSDKLAPAGMAEVELVFDNSNGALPIEFSEVAVSRRIYRDGEGAYFINRSSCRLVDVVELLSDAGLGKGTHIVSQGRVEAILESKPEERRGYIEEAAGLGKFKKRRHRAGLKLAAVRRNLDRLSDVEEELRSKAGPLKRQASAAERSARLRQQAAEAETRLLKGRLGLLTGRLGKAEAAIAAASAERASLEEQIAAASEERRRTEELLAASLKEHKQMAARFYQLRSSQENLSGRRSELKLRFGVLRAAEQKAVARKASLQGRLAQVKSELAQAQAGQESAAARVENIQAELEEKLAELQGAEDEIDRRRRASEKKSQRRGELGALKEKYKLQIEYLSSRREKLAAAAERAGMEILERSRQLEMLEEQARERLALTEKCRRSAAEAEARLGKINANCHGAQSSKAEAETRLRQVSEDLKIAKARLTFIAASGRDRTGLSPAAKKLSRENGIPAVMELIEVEPGYEQAVAAVLSDVLFALAVPDLDQARQLLQAAVGAQQGGLDIVTPGGSPASGRGHGDYLIDHVTIPSPWLAYLAPFLEDVRVAGSTDEITQRAAGNDENGCVWVTREGVIYRPGRRLLSYRPELPASLVMKHKSEQRLLEQERDRADQLCKELESSIGEIASEQKRLEEERSMAEEDLRLVLLERDNAEAEASASERQKKVLQQEAELKDGARQQLLAEQEALEEEMSMAAARLTDAEASLSEIEAAGDGEGRGSGEALAASRIRLSQRATELKIEAARLRERIQAAGQASERLQVALAGLESELDGCLFQIDACGRLQPICLALLEKMGRLADLFLAVTGGLEEKLALGEQLAEQHSASLGKLSTLEAGLQQKLAEAGKTATDREVLAAKLREQAAELSSRLGSLYERFSRAGLAEIEAAAETELEETEAHLERLVRRQELIGPVNPLAQQEYEELRERQEFLAGQRADLEASLKELSGLIAELTSRIETSFNDTFAAVSGHFADVVSTLFPGGQGRLLLAEPAGEPDGVEEARPGEEGSLPKEEEEEDDEPFQSGDRRGVEIRVKLARKSARNLSLLSGGERSLVAVAFLFAIFLVRPAPFYILDEIEAALDDVNITRLLNMIRRYQHKTQFIVITHQKRTMECADVLYGVSMGADGTSKVLSRRMDKTATAGSTAGTEAKAGKEAEPALAG